MLNRISEEKTPVELLRSVRSLTPPSSLRSEVSSLLQGGASSLLESMNANGQIIASALKEAQQAVGTAAGEIQSVFSRKLSIHPDGRTEIDFSTMITISTDGQRRR